MERFSFDFRSVLDFSLPDTTLRDWLRKLAPLLLPIRSYNKTNCDSFALVFPRFSSTTCNYLEF